MTSGLLAPAEPRVASPLATGITAEPGESFASLAARSIAPRSAQAHEAEVLDRLSWRRLAEHGLWRIGVPARLGGTGGSWKDLALAIADVARGSDDLGFTLSLIAHAGLIRALVLHGNEWHHRNVLPPLLGGAIGATALTSTALATRPGLARAT